MQDAVDDDEPDVEDIPGRVRELVRRSGVAGGAALRQRWKRRYLVLTEDWVEFYREVERKGVVGVGSKKLDRVLRERVSAVWQVTAAEDFSHFTLFVKDEVWTLSAESSESAQAWLAEFERAQTQSKTGSVELRAKLKEFSHAQDFGKDEVLTRMDQIVDFAKDRGMLSQAAGEVLDAYRTDKDYDAKLEQEERNQDDLGRAFTLLRQAVDTFVEGEVLNPQAAAMRIVRESVEAGCAYKAAAVLDRVDAYIDEPQSAPFFEIKEKFHSPSSWDAAVKCLQQLDVEDWPLPLAAAGIIMQTVNTIYQIHSLENPGSNAVMGADDLNPIVIFVIVKARVRFLPLFVEMMGYLCPLDGETGYNVIMITGMLSWIGSGAISIEESWFPIKESWFEQSGILISY